MVKGSNALLKHKGGFMKRNVFTWLLSVFLSLSFVGNGFSATFQGGAVSADDQLNRGKLVELWDYRFYECWTTTSSAFIFYGFNFSTGGGSVNGETSATLASCQMNTGAAIDNNIYMYASNTGTQDMLPLTSTKRTLKGRINFSGLNYTGVFGWRNTGGPKDMLTANSGTGCFFRNDSAGTNSNTFAVCKSAANTETVIDTGVTNDGWKVYRVDINSSEADFYIDGVLIGTIDTNIPSGDFGMIIGCRTAEAVTKTCRIDWMEFKRARGG